MREPKEKLYRQRKQSLSRRKSARRNRSSKTYRPEPDLSGTSDTDSSYSSVSSYEDEDSDYEEDPYTNAENGQSKSKLKYTRMSMCPTSPTNSEAQTSFRSVTRSESDCGIGNHSMDFTGPQKISLASVSGTASQYNGERGRSPRLSNLAAPLKSSSEPRICLICPKVPQPSCGDKFSSLDNKALPNAIKKIFQYLLIPHSKQEAIRDLIDFCPDCFTMVRDIMAMQKKMQVLELMIQYKVEKLGKIILETPMRGLVGKGKASQKIWKKFRQPVVKCFLKGYLPSPSVCLTAEPESSKDHQSSTPETPEEPSQILEKTTGLLQSKQNANKKDTEGLRVSTTDDSSPSVFIKVEDSREEIGNNVDIESVKVEHVHSDVEDISGETILHENDDSSSPDAGEKLVPAALVLCSDVSTNDVMSDGRSNKINPGNMLNDQAQEKTATASKFVKHRKRKHLDNNTRPEEIRKISTENDARERAVVGLLETQGTRKPADNENEGQLKTQLERKRGWPIPVESSAHKRFKHSSNEESERIDASGSDLDIILDDVREKESERELEACKTSQKSSTLDPTASENCYSNPVVSTQTTRKKKRPKKKKKKVLISAQERIELTKPKKYSRKCPYCLYRVTSKSDGVKSKTLEGEAYVLYKLGNHFTQCHNPIKYDCVSISPNGNECYNCSKCDFYCTFDGDNKRPKALRDLSLHYITIHCGYKQGRNRNRKTNK